MNLEDDVDSLIKAEDVEGLIKALKSENYIIRKEAAIGLTKVVDERALNPLINSLRYHDWQRDYIILTSVREKSAEALGLIGDPTATPYLIIALENDPDEDVRSKAAYALGEIGDPKGVNSLINALSDRSWAVRKQSANSLGNIGGKEATDPLIDALEDRDWHVRKYAAVALGKLKDERAIPTLLESLNDEDSDVRWKAESGLVKIGEKAVEPLIELISTKDWQLRARAVEVLGKIGDDRAIKPLIKIITPGKYWDQHRQVRGKTAEALGKIGDHEALNALKELNSKDDYKYVREKAYEAICKIDSREICNIMNYDNGEVCFDFPDDWEIYPTEDQTKILKGQYANSSITFSLNRKADVEEISSEEFGQMLKDVLAIQNSSIIYENIQEKENMEIYEIVAENKEVKATRIVIVSFKLDDLLYYMWFAGDPNAFKNASESIDQMIDTFFIYPLD
jgi:HEAT repeat protein